MPLYEYQCTGGHRFEMLQKVSDSPIKKCVRCGAKAERLLSSPAIQFKGSGWYITDYARKGENTSKKKSESTSTPSTTDKSRTSGATESASSTTKSE